MIRVLLLLSLMTIFVSCGHRRDAKTFMRALEAHTGDDYEIAKLWTETGDYVVFKNKDTGEYEAYNMDKWNRKNDDTYADFLARGAVDGVDIVLDLERHREWRESGYWEDVYQTDYEYWEYWDEDCECYRTEVYEYTYWVGERWVDTSRWYTYYTGNGYTFSNTQNISRDLESLASIEESVQEGIIANALKSEYSLSASRSTELAKLMIRFQKLENIRELTADEKNEFSFSAMGLNYSQLEQAVQARMAGDSAQFNNLIQEAANVNGTTTEQIGEFFDDHVLETI